MKSIFGADRFDSSKLKSHLKMTQSRIELLKNKKRNGVKLQRRQIAELLRQGKDESARIKVENVIRDDFMIEAFEILELFCDLVQSRVTLIAESKTCPTDLKEAVSSLLYAAPRCDIPELMVIRDQLTKKFGKEFVSAASENRDFAVNQRILIKLSVKIPEPYLCVHYLKDIAEENGIELDESLHQPVGPEVPTSAFSGGSGGASGGGGGMMMDTHMTTVQPPMINVNGAYDLQPSLHMDHQAMSNQLFHQQQQQQQQSHMQQQHQQFPQQAMQPPMQHQMGVMYPSPSHLDPYGLSSSSSSTNMNNMNSMNNNNVNNNNSNRLSGSMQPLQQQQQPQPQQQQIPPLNQLTQSGYNVDFTPGHLIGPQSTMPKLSDYQPQQQQQQFPSMNNVHGMDDDGFIQSSSDSQPAPSYDFDDLQKRFEALKRREL